MKILAVTNKSFTLFSQCFVAELTAQSTPSQAIAQDYRGRDVFFLKVLGPRVALRCLEFAKRWL